MINGVGVEGKRYAGSYRELKLGDVVVEVSEYAACRIWRDVHDAATTS